MKPQEFYICIDVYTNKIVAVQREPFDELFDMRLGFIGEYVKVIEVLENEKE